MKSSIYQRPDKPRRLVVRSRKVAPVVALPDISPIATVDRASECHVTPLPVAQRMADYLGSIAGQSVLEPQAGTGNLIQAVFASGEKPALLTAIERHSGLCVQIHRRFEGVSGLNLVNDCFLHYAATNQGTISFSRIICNPPFRHVKKHMAAALSLLGGKGDEGSRLIALVPITYQHPEADLIEELPSDVFSTAKVYTKIIQVDR